MTQEDDVTPSRSAAHRRGGSVHLARLTRVAAGLSVGLAVMLTGSPLAPTHEGVAANAHALTGVHVFGQGGFNEPIGIAVAGNHVWVANQNGNSVSELDATTGAVVTTLSAPEYW